MAYCYHIDVYNRQREAPLLRHDNYINQMFATIETDGEINIGLMLF